MAYRGSTARVRAPLQARSRRRWLLTAGIAGLWLVFVMGSGSLVAATVLLLLLGAVAGGVVMVLRLFGFGRDHPWFQHAASRPWRDGRDVLRVALRHLPEVFIVTPQGSLLAPNAVELRMNPADVESLADLIDLNLVSASAAEAYAAEVAAHSARVVSNVPLEVGVVADGAVPPGRYRLRQRSSLAAMTPAADPAAGVAPFAGAAPFAAADPVTSVGPFAGADPVTSVDPACAAYPVSMPGPSGAPGPAGGAYPVSAGVGPFRDGRTKSELAVAPAFMTGAATVAEPALPPLLRLITNGAVAETRVSGARAGRGKAVELQLPGDPTVSRVHATFTCTGGEWRITVLGRNGVLLNGTPLTSEHVVRDGDAIRWGQQSSAPVSAVVIR
ncbi:MAG TPA: FHA domain-containing protein [Streptosporangiaceae bacterium]|nr:FHA domain-containing protein [Streptosporangiaceae bacterium]